MSRMWVGFFLFILSPSLISYAKNPLCHLRDALKKVSNPSSGGAKPMNLAHLTVFVNTKELSPKLKEQNLLPRGSALLTRSGELAKTGIKAIIHAATGAMTHSGSIYEPTLESIQSSIRASIQLARDHGYSRIAIPFIGGKIFLDRIGVTAEKLSDAIVKASLADRQNIEIRFVTYGPEDTQLFKVALENNRENLTPQEASIVSGSITDFKLHGAPVIVNAANMEVQFGGGLSGVIAKATGEKDAIDAEAQQLIQNYYRELK